MNQEKDFFPDEWSELKVIDEIKHAWGNKVFQTGNTFDGYATNGIKIRMFIANEGLPNERIISAFPQ